LPVYILYLYADILTIREGPCITFPRCLTQQIQFYYFYFLKKTKIIKNCKKENFNKQLETSQIILKILSSIENDKIKIQCKFKSSTVIRFRISTT